MKYSQNEMEHLPLESVKQEKLIDWRDMGTAAVMILAVVALGALVFTLT